MEVFTPKVKDRNEHYWVDSSCVAIAVSSLTALQLVRRVTAARLRSRLRRHRARWSIWEGHGRLTKFPHN